NGVIDLARERFTKNLWTERDADVRPQLVSVHDEADQASYVVERVLENREAGSLLKQQAVLFRTSHHCGPPEVELTRRNIPFVKFGGLVASQSARRGAAARIAACGRPRAAVSVAIIAQPRLAACRCRRGRHKSAHPPAYKSPAAARRCGDGCLRDHSSRR